MDIAERGTMQAGSKTECSFRSYRTVEIAHSAGPGQLAVGLGLEGQIPFYSCDRPEDLLPAPYPKVSAAVKVTYQEAFPEYDKVSEYSKSVIPEIVLRELASVKQRGHFDEVTIRYREDGDECVMLAKTSTYSQDDYLICQWRQDGDEMLQGADLKQVAALARRLKMKTFFESLAKKLENAEEAMQQMSDDEIVKCSFPSAFHIPELQSRD